VNNAISRIVITGAIGHIGSYLIRYFCDRFPGAEIIMIDNMMTQRFPSLFQLPPNGRYRFIQADVTKLDLLPILEGADVMIHLAAITDAASSFDNASLLEENNFNATTAVAEACAQAGTCLIALSSTSVYGTQNDIVDENCTQEELSPQSPYAITKLKEEALIARLCNEKGLKAVSCRFGTIFGPSVGMRFHTAVNKFCWQAVMGQPITVWSTAYDQKRPYLDLLDAARAIAFIIEKNLFGNGVYNVLTLNATVHQVVDVIRDFIPNLEISFVDSRIMNQLSYEVSCERFKGEGFEFKGNLHKSIGQTIDLLRHANDRDITIY
jgi:nucleoside-diphosphate-sugar epimerase